MDENGLNLVVVLINFFLQIVVLYIKKQNVSYITRVY